MKDQITVFAPATVANVGCGYDVLGFALETLGDYMTIEKSDSPGFEITLVEGDNIPLDPKENVASVASEALLSAFGKVDYGFKFGIKKMVRPGSGLGSSASSSAAAVFGINELMGRPFSKEELIAFAAEGEKTASGKVHHDNVAAAIYGGFILVQDRDPLNIVQLDYPQDLYVVIAHPQVEVKTLDAKKILRREVPLTDAITQWANTAGLMVGLCRNDYDLISRSMKDVIIEPSRSILIPMYKQVQETAIGAGALGCNIAGSGPSIFCFCQGISSAETVKKEVEEVYSDSDLTVSYLISKINPQGAQIVEL